MAKKAGFVSCIARNLNGTFAGTPLWTPLIRLRDIKGNRAPGGTPDVSDRQVDVYSTLPVRKKISYDADATWDKGDGLTALRTAFLAKTGIDLAAIDEQPTNSGKGYRGKWAVTKFNLDFPLLGEQKLSVSIKPHGSVDSSERVAAYTDATVVAGTAETPGTKRAGHVASVNSSGGTPFTGVRDWKLMLEYAEGDSSDRSNEFEMVNLHQLKISAEVQFHWDATEFAAFKTAFDDNSPIELFLLDGAYATTGSWGVHADFAVTDFPKEDPLTDNQKCTVKLEIHGNSSTLPVFVTI